MNANIHIEELETEFMNAGFIIKNRDKSQRQAIKKNVIEESHSLEVFSKYVNNKKQLINTSINELFKENKFNSFRGFCAYKGISSILDVSETLIKEYSQMRQVGQGKIRAVEERLAEVLNSKMDYELLKKTLDTKEENLQFDNRYAGEMEISQLFQESRYIKFREFCREEGVRFVRQIQEEHLAAFSSLPGIGKKKVKDVVFLLNQHTKLGVNIPSEFHSGELFKYIQHMKVTSLLDSYSYQTASRSSLTIADIEGKSFEELERDFNRKILLEVSSRIGQQKLPKTIVNEIRSVLSEREIKIIELRFIERLTLEETAKFFEITRERIRQIEARALKRIFQHLEMNQFHFVVILLCSSNTLVTKSELLAFIGEENNFLIEVLKSKNDFFSYFEKLDVFFYNVQDQITLSLIDDFIVELPENFYLFEYEPMLKEIMEKIGISDLTIEMIEELLHNYGLNKYGKLYSKSKLHISDVLEHLFRMYIKNPLRIDEKGIEKLQMLALQHLNYQLEGSLRSIEARIRDANNVILVDKSTYQWFESENFDRNIVSKIDDYLQERFLEVKVINIEEVFKRFEKLLEPFNISNKLHLYSIVKYYLEEEYS
ncbi:sigma factor-like helix-turn-helix DNA-binding protein, partial [Priestia megaterium]|uniref:sigma factor-like helix-turn-helix DNA-binding protein n=1 Tax=Priestia megaterium TaxID=1404 RepID=UPI002FFE2929